MVWPLSLDKQASLGTSTWKRMFPEAEGITSRIPDGSPLWRQSWVIFVKLPLTLDGYVLNDIWTIVQKSHA